MVKNTIVTYFIIIWCLYICVSLSRHPLPSPVTNRALCLFRGRAAGCSSRRRPLIFRELEIMQMHVIAIRVVRSLIPSAHISLLLVLRQFDSTLPFAF